MSTAAYQREWRRKNLKRSNEIVENSRLMAKYGIRRHQFDELLARQDGRCAACRTADNGVNNRTGEGARKWSVDHDHDTGQIRGILCHRCNSALGMLDDSAYRLTALLDYLGRPPVEIL